MLPVDFAGRNKILTGPKGSNVLDLPSFCNDVVCVSCWQLSESEKLELSASRQIWVFLWYGHVDPIRLSAVCPINSATLNTDPISSDIIHTEPEFCITAWPFSDEEIELIQATGRFWFVIQSGKTQPPVGFTVSSPFINQENESVDIAEEELPSSL